MTEFEMLERGSSCGSNDLAFALVATKAGFDQVLGQDKIGVVASHERVRDIRMDVERLVGWDRPRRGGPDHCVDWAVERLRISECAGELRQIGVGHPEADIDREI